MAQSRGKSGSRRRSSKRSSSAGGSIWPWLAALVVVGGGLAVYENSAAARRFIAGLKDDRPATVAAKVKPSNDKPAADKPVPPKTVAAGPLRQVPPRPSTPPDGSHTAAIIPPAPIGRPTADDAAKPAVLARSDDRLAGAYEAKFFLCGTAKQDDCVVSADRFVFHGQKIRLVGIEVPDIKKPRCEDERIKASDAELRVRAFLDSGPFELVTWQGNDGEVDGHKLRQVTRNGMSLSDILVKEGLAKRPGSGKGWC
jgi:endonuclease YncB( thermonuclease family)